MTGVRPEAWSVTASRRIIDDRWIHLRADDCVDAAGRVIAPFYVLEASDWVGIVALTPEREVVVVTEYRHGAGAVLAGLPGGAIDVGEDPLVAARRELVEETGYASDEWIALGASRPNPANQDNHVHYFLALDAHRVADQALDPGELIDVSLEPLAGLADRIEHALHQLPLLKAERWLTAGGG